MSYTRHQLKEAIEAALTNAEISGYVVVPEPREMPEPDPSVICYLQIVRKTIKRNPKAPTSGYEETHELWVIEPSKDPYKIEDNLDDRLNEVFGMLDTLKWLTWSSAERKQHPSNRHAYLITLQLDSYKE